MTKTTKTNKKHKLDSVAIKAEVGKWGNALAVRLPQFFVNEKGIVKGSVVILNNIEVVVEDEN
jgi:antitoxin component of MazEF toxin-antitoxin module